MNAPFKERKPPTDAEIREYFQILKADPRSRVFAPLTEALIRRGRLDEAEQLCRYGLDSNQDFSDGHLAFARVLFYRFRYQEALSEVKLTLALDPRSTEAYLIAAEIFLARSQHKAANDACLKALDLDPDNQQAIRVVARLGSIPQQLPAGQVPTGPDPALFKSSAGTSPSHRRLEPGDPPTMTNPFQQLMQDLEDEAARLLDQDDQPFTALSSGSQTDVPALGPNAAGLSEADFEIPTAPIPRPDREIPRLPARPPTPAPTAGQQASSPPANAPPASFGPGSTRPGSRLPPSSLPPTPPPGEPPGSEPVAPEALDDLLAQAPQPTPGAGGRPSEPDPLPTAPPPAAEGHVPEPIAPPGWSETPATARWARVDTAQTIIDSYRDKIPHSPDDGPPLRVPRLGALLPLLGMLALLAGVVVLLLVLIPSGFRDKSARPAPAPEPDAVGPLAEAGTGPLLPDPVDPPPETPDSAAPEGPTDPQPAPAQEAKPAGDPPKSATKKSNRRKAKRRRKR